MRDAEKGATGRLLSRIGLGAWAIGGTGYAYSWGGQNDKDSIRTIFEAFDSGVNWIDTSPVYGLGHSENVIGRALRELSFRPRVSSKCGLAWTDTDRRVRHDLSPRSIRAECEATLGRLGLETIDLYFIHWPKPEDQIEQAWEELSRLQEQGKILLCGVSNFSRQQMERLLQIRPIDVVQVPYNIINREIEHQILPYCRENSISVVTYGPMQHGLITGKLTRDWAFGRPRSDWRRRSEYLGEPVLGSMIELVQGLNKIAVDLDCSVAQLAVAWVLKNEAVTSAIVGARSPGQIRETSRAEGIQLSDGICEQIDLLLETSCLIRVSQ